MENSERDQLRDTCLTLWSTLHYYESACVPWTQGQNNQATVEPVSPWAGLTAMRVLLTLESPAQEGLPSSPQDPFLLVELCHIPGDVSFRTEHILGAYEDVLGRRYPPGLA